MTKIRELYECAVCGNLVEVVHAGAPALVCCKQPMTLLEGNTVDASGEKHVPVVQSTENGVLAKVGSIEHPMEEKHYIAFIEVLTADKVYRAELKPGQKPEAFFPVTLNEIVEVREYCNLHGLWKA
ncbi:MAG: desulfoferrodoxin [Peptococcaceae bacterium]|nr:desulfoferrodoxin [Peptococcaceae bacterium]